VKKLRVIAAILSLTLLAGLRVLAQAS